MSTLNALLLLPPTRMEHALKRAHRIITLDDNEHEIKKITEDVPIQFRPDLSFDRIDFSAVLEMEKKASNLSRIKQALCYYSGEATWFRFYQVYECAWRDCDEMMSGRIPEHWTTDEHGRNRLKDFTQSANNTAYSSGYAAWHRYADSEEIERISPHLIQLKKCGKEVVVMSLDDARIFLEQLLVHWSDVEETVSHLLLQKVALL